MKNNFTKTKIKNIILEVKFLRLLKQIAFIFMGFGFAFIIVGWLMRISLPTNTIVNNNLIEKVEAKEFVYKEEAKIADLEAIKLNRKVYLEKIEKEKQNKWTDEKVIEEAIKFLERKEGVRYKAYWDFKQWSICYGNKSYKGAIATHQECENQLRQRVQNELLRINRLADNIAGYKKVALISFFYNVGYKYNILQYARRGDDKSVIYLMNKYKYAGGKYNKHLAKRRKEEIKIYLGNFIN